MDEWESVEAASNMQDLVNEYQQYQDVSDADDEADADVNAAAEYADEAPMEDDQPAEAEPAPAAAAWSNGFFVILITCSFLLF